MLCLSLGNVAIGTMVEYRAGDGLRRGRIESFFVCDYDWEGPDVLSKLNPPLDAVWCEIRRLHGPFERDGEAGHELYALEGEVEDVRYALACPCSIVSCLCMVFLFLEIFVATLLHC
jgi:hypothetical protein